MVGTCLNDEIRRRIKGRKEEASDSGDLESQSDDERSKDKSKSKGKGKGKCRGKRKGKEARASTAVALYGRNEAVDL